MHAKATVLSWEKESDRERLVGDLHQNRVVVSSTDTVYGFLGNTSKESYGRICKLKKISHGRPFLMLVGSVNRIFSFIDRRDVSNRKLVFLERCWPGPLTVIFRAKDGISTVALRSPNHVGLRAVLEEFDALFSTSANRSGEPAPTKLLEVAPEILNEVPYVMVDTPELGENQASTIIDFSNLTNVGFTVVRKGAYSVEELRKTYESIGE